jgi:flagellar motor switch protein FliN/FliY
MSRVQGDLTAAETSEVSRVEMPELAAGTGDRAAPFLKRQLDLIRGVKVKVAVSLGGAEVSVGKLFDLKSGEVVALDRRINELLDLTIDGKLVARGELVVAGDNLGLRIVEIVGA